MSAPKPHRRHADGVRIGPLNVSRAKNTRVAMTLQGPILVGTDLSAASEEALRQGNDLANDLGTSLVVCHVVPDLDAVNVLFPQWAAGNAEHREVLISKAMA